MNQVDRLRHLVCRWLVGLLCGIWGGQCTAADRLLIDDFSINQAGVVTGSDAAFDPLVDPTLFAGGREIWGGGANNSPVCSTCTVAASVHDGAFEISVNDIPSGGGAVTWPGRISATNIDISDFSYVSFEVVDIGAPVLSRLSLADTDGSVKSADVVLSSVGTHSIRIPNDFDKHTLARITLAFLVGRQQQFAISSVELIVPEPPTGALAFLVFVAGLAVIPQRFRYA